MALSRIVVACAGAGLIMSGPGHAADPAGQPRHGLGFTIGLGMVVTPDYEGSNDAQVLPAGFARVSNLYHRATYVQLSGLRLDSNLLPDDHWRLGVVAAFQRDYRHVDDGAVKRLRRPDDALQAGLVFGYDFSDRRNAPRVIEVEATYDILHGNGALITPRARAAVPLAVDFSLGVALSATWASGAYMSNRFGIASADSARSGLRPYNADAGFKDVALSLSLTYAFTPRWSLTGFTNVRRLMGDAADSPIVDDRGSRTNLTAGALMSVSF